MRVAKLLLFLLSLIVMVKEVAMLRLLPKRLKDHQVEGPTVTMISGGPLIGLMGEG